MPLRIKLLGPLRIEEESGAPSALMEWSKGCALLAYLAVTGRPQMREALADLLWDASTTAQSLQNLRKLLSRMRKWAPELHITRKQVALPDTSTDFHTLTAALAAGELEPLDEALRGYEGELLEGFYLDGAPRFNEWLLLEREQLRQRVAAAYGQVCAAYAEQQAWPKGIDAARRWYMLDELDERALRRLLQLLAASGQVGVALQQYEAGRRLLAAELGVEPEPETAQLARRLARLKAETGGGIAWDTVVGAQPEWPEAGRLAEPGPLPANAYLPYRRNNEFTGRRALLLQLAGRLLPQPGGEQRQPPAVAITGMGGIGKTQLAVEFAYRYGRFFPGGVYWLNFADAGNVANEVAALGGEQVMALYREAEQLTVAEQAGRVQRAWQEPIPRLLIFDNCEEPELLAMRRPVTGGCRVLLTSRRATWPPELQVGACPLVEFPPHESVLFLQKLAPHLTPTEAREIAAEAGHLPLALHLAGGFLRHYRQISPARYLAQLRQQGLHRHPSLRGRGLSYSPTGHELDVSRTFAASLAQLDPADEIDETARRLLAHAACFAPGEAIPKNLLQATLLEEGSGDENDIMGLLLAEDGLARLIALGFLQGDDAGGLVMHRLLAAFATELLDIDADVQMAVEQALLQKLLTHWGRKGRLRILPFSAVHLQHVTNNTFARSEHPTYRLGTFLAAHLRAIGDPDSAQKYLADVLSAAKMAGDINGQAEAKIWMATVQHEIQNDIRLTLHYAEQAEQLLRGYEAVDNATLALVLHYKGWALYKMGKAGAALAACEEALTLSAAANMRVLQGDTLNIMAMIAYYILGSFEDAFHYHERALAIVREVDNRFSEQMVLNNMGESARLQGKYIEAVDLYQQALDVALELGSPETEILTRNNLCGALLGLGAYDVVAAELEELIPEISEIWSKFSEAHRFLARARLGQGKTSAALAAARQALALADATTGAPFDLGRAWRVLGEIAARKAQPIRVAQGDDRRYDAPACFARSVEIFTNFDVPRDRALALWRWAEYELSQGSAHAGEKMWQQARETFKRLNLPLFVAEMDATP